MGLVTNRPKHIPNSDSLAVRVISENKHYPKNERTADEAHIVGPVRWFARGIEKVIIAKAKSSGQKSL